MNNIDKEIDIAVHELKKMIENKKAQETGK
jgi:hypothetical protein